MVTLPSDFTGGESVVEHRGEKASDRGSPGELGVLAFCADCHHKAALPVTDGFRISLTYNLIASGRTAASGDQTAVAAPAGHLREHFSTPIPVPTRLRDGRPASRPPLRLVHLLDHRYSRRGFGWDRLEGFEYEAHEGALPVDHPDRIETARLGEDFGSNATLTWWIDRSGNAGSPVDISISEVEICSGTEESAHQLFATESAGYMGNEGDTIDRWYRCAAIVVQPRTAQL